MVQNTIVENGHRMNNKIGVKMGKETKTLKNIPCLP